jgi:hypothetical protein
MQIGVVNSRYVVPHEPGGCDRLQQARASAENHGTGGSTAIWQCGRLKASHGMQKRTCFSRLLREQPCGTIGLGDGKLATRYIA